MLNRRARPLFVLHDDDAFLERLRSAAMPEYAPARVAGWEALFGAIAAAPISSVVVADPYVGRRRGEGMAPEMGALLHRFPSVTVVAALRLRSGCFEDVRALGAWGVSQVVCLDEEETPVALRERLEAARGRPLRNLVERILPAGTSGTARSLLQTASAVVTDGGTGRELARALFVTPRTLLRWCRRAGLPPPKRLLPWMRILLAAELLDDPGRSVRDAALATGYASDSGLRHATGAFLGLSPGDLRRRGGVEAAAAAFLEELSRARRKDRRYRRPSRSAAPDPA